jgi:hypothetical protein
LGAKPTSVRRQTSVVASKHEAASFLLPVSHAASGAAYEFYPDAFG